MWGLSKVKCTKTLPIKFQIHVDHMITIHMNFKRRADKAEHETK